MNSSYDNNCRRGQTPCFDYRTTNNTSICAPAITCSILESCNHTGFNCSTTSSVCIVNSCCSSQAVCIPIEWINFCQSGQWRLMNTMQQSRSYHTASLLPDGKVLVVGGIVPPTTYQDTAEIFHPSNETFTLTSTMSTTRAYHTASILQNGYVLVAGGYNSGGTGLAQVEFYNSSSDTWIAVSSMNRVRYQHSAVVLLNGTVLVIGGIDSVAISDVELYDPSTDTWTSVASMIFPPIFCYCNFIIRWKSACC